MNRRQCRALDVKVAKIQLSITRSFTHLISSTRSERVGRISNVDLRPGPPALAPGPRPKSYKHHPGRKNECERFPVLSLDLFQKAWRSDRTQRRTATGWLPLSQIGVCRSARHPNNSRSQSRSPSRNYRRFVSSRDRSKAAARNRSK